ncbi:MAG: glycosyltransferase family 4 protein [Saprospiraceae bacterium]|nr:glycosyltransferase family 4 protein [Saprospiraceae bacterium]
MRVHDENKRRKIVILYAELQAYNIPIFQEFIDQYYADVWVVRWDQNLKIKYTPPPLSHLSIHQRSDYDERGLYQFTKTTSPDLIITSGWMDPVYLKVCKKIRSEFKTPVIALSDTQWNGQWRQWIARFVFKWTHKTAFSHTAVAGPRQKQYAIKLGFDTSKIIDGCLSADLDLFNEYYQKTILEKRNKYPHRFLFIGRFASEKGIELLLQAWSEIKEKKDWDLIIIGKGPLILNTKNIDAVNVQDFIPSTHLLETIQNSGCLVVPSLFEPWSITIHEFAAAGFPILSSMACGANDLFVKHGENGYIFPTGNLESLKSNLLQIMNLSDEELLQFAERSHELGQKINPQMIARGLMGAVEERKSLNYDYK